MELNREYLLRMMRSRSAGAVFVEGEGGDGEDSSTPTLGELLTSLNSQPMPTSDGYLHWTGTDWEWDDLSAYATQSWVTSSLLPYATQSWVTSSLSDYATKSYVDSTFVPFSANPALIGPAQGSATIANFDPQTDTVHITAQVLGSSAQAQARENISAVGSSDIKQIVKMTQAAYDLITPDSHTLYIITSS